MRAILHEVEAAMDVGFLAEPALWEETWTRRPKYRTQNFRVSVIMLEATTAFHDGSSNL